MKWGPCRILAQSPFFQHVVEIEQSRSLQNNGRAEDACWAHEKNAQTGDKDVLQIRPSKQDKVTLFYLKPFIYGPSSDGALNLSNSKTVFATHPYTRFNSEL